MFWSLTSRLSQHCWSKPGRQKHCPTHPKDFLTELENVAKLHVGTCRGSGLAMTDFANSLTEARLVRSRSIISTLELPVDATISFTAFKPRSLLRHPKMRKAPRRANSRAVWGRIFFNISLKIHLKTDAAVGPCDHHKLAIQPLLPPVDPHRQLLPEPEQDKQESQPVGQWEEGGEKELKHNYYGQYLLPQ